MNYCPDCGAEVDETDSFCAACGYELAPDAPEEYEPEGFLEKLGAAVIKYL